MNAKNQDRSKFDPGSGPLAGIRLIDMTGVLLGPYATQILGDLGADIIKVEAPDGDILRWGVPPTDRNIHPDMGPIYLTVNRNKRSVVLDLQKEGGREAMRRLLKSADAFMTNVRGAGLARLGFDYEGAKAIKPDLVYVHCVGFAEGGAYAGRQAYDDLVQAASGITDLMPRVDGDPTPRMLPSLVADKATGLHAVYATLAALFHRERTGEGQYVEVPMMEAMVSFTMAEHLFGAVYDGEAGLDEGYGYPRVMTRNRRPYPTKDGYIAILPYRDRDWPTFFEIAGRRDLWDAFPHKDYAARTRHTEELYGLIGSVTPELTTDDWLEKLTAANIPAMKVNRLSDLMDDPHMQSVGFFERRDHPTEGPYTAMAHPVNFKGTPASIRTDAPRLGADGRAAMAELGFDEDDVRALEEEGALGLPPSD